MSDNVFVVYIEHGYFYPEEDGVGGEFLRSEGADCERCGSDCCEHSLLRLILESRDGGFLAIDDVDYFKDLAKVKSLCDATLQKWSEDYRVNTFGIIEWKHGEDFEQMEWVSQKSLTKQGERKQ